MTKSITRRWLRSNLLITAILLLLIEAVFSFFTISNYYGDTRQALQSRIDNIYGQLIVSSNISPDGRSAVLHTLVEEFAESAKFELMLIDNNGEVIANSGSYISEPDEMPDVEEAFTSSLGTGEFTGNMLLSGEPIMAVSTLVPYASADVAAIRIVVSLTLVNSAIINTLLASFIVVISIFFFSLFTGLYFVNSIVRPITRIEKTASRIAKGDFNVRIDNTYNDEIGNLCDTINHMANSLSETQRLKNEFISSVSHELRTPLTSIKGWSETLVKFRTLGGDSAKKALAIIGKETERLSMMVEELLDFSRMQDRGIQLVKERIDLIAELADAVYIAGGRATTEKVEIIFQEPEDVIAVNADKNRLRQVFLNALDNAVKYSPQDGKVMVNVLKEGGWITVKVSDEGCGIPSEDLPHIKEKFYKAGNAKKGSGIGLAVAEEIMHAHGGSIDIISTEGEGTTVIIMLPMEM